jgi:hypothetical protein
MLNDGRSFIDIVEDIIEKVEDIVRSEVRLARAEITSETKKAARAGAVLAAGGVLAVYSLGLLMLAGVYGLALALPLWAAALIVCAVVSAAAATLVVIGRGRLKEVYPKAETTSQSIKENVGWLKNQTR